MGGEAAPRKCQHCEWDGRRRDSGLRAAGPTGRAPSKARGVLTRLLCGEGRRHGKQEGEESDSAVRKGQFNPLGKEKPRPPEASVDCARRAVRSPADAQGRQPGRQAGQSRVSIRLCKRVKATD